MLKVKVRWQGFTGSPGWSNFYFAPVDPSTFFTQEDAVDAVNRVKTFFDAVDVRFPAAMSWQIQSDVDIIGETDGKMVNVFSVPPIPAIPGGAVAAPHSGASGVVITWRTAGVRNGRRVRGRTFLVPTSNTVYENNGTLNATIQGEFQTAANTLAAQTAGMGLAVWARPTVPQGTDGEVHLVTAATVPDLASILRSRRD